MSSLLNLRKFVVPEIIFGSGARLLAGRYAQQFSASKVLVVTDKGVIEAGWLKDIEESLQEAGIAYFVFSEVSPNPRYTEVMKGAEIYEEEECDVIIAVGGGSPMDCAKGIGIVSSHDLNILNFEGVDKIQMPVPPLIFIPTTSGSSSDISQFCIILDQDKLVKIAIVSKAIVPDVALIDPATISTMDPFLTACTGVDGLVHSIEAFVSTGGGVLTDTEALKSIELMYNNLPGFVKDNQNEELRKNIMLGSMKAGMAFSNASLGAVHAMAHSLGGFSDLPHGECNAMLLEHVVNFNFDRVPEKFKIIAEIFDVKTKGMTTKQIKDALIIRIIEFKKKVGITHQLRKMGIKSSDIPELASKAVKDACMITNPRVANSRDVEVIFEEAL